MEPDDDHPPADTAPARPGGEAGRRVRLANERTYLAWGRTALAAFALALAVGRIVPELERSKDRWAFELVGCAYAALGVIYAAYGLHRHRAVEDAIDQGTFATPAAPVLTGMTVVTAIVGAATFVLLIAG
jgi:putative membrane protein